jgi:hypothetical protein
MLTEKCMQSICCYLKVQKTKHFLSMFCPCCGCYKMHTIMNTLMKRPITIQEGIISFALFLTSFLLILYSIHTFILLPSFSIKNSELSCIFILQMAQFWAQSCCLCKYVKIAMVREWRSIHSHKLFPVLYVDSDQRFISILCHIIGVWKKGWLGNGICFYILRDYKLL